MLAECLVLWDEEHLQHFEELVWYFYFMIMDAENCIT